MIYFLFLVCFFLKTVAFEAEWPSDEAVDGLLGDNGVKVDCVFKAVVSVGVGGKDVGGVTLPIFKVGRPFAVKREFRTVSTVSTVTVSLTFWYLFLERAAHSKSAMIVVFFAVNTRPIAGSAFTVSMLKRGTWWAYFIILWLCAWRCGVIFELVTFEAN